MKKTFKAIELEGIAKVLNKIMPKTKGILGYAIARNYRVFKENLIEYENCSNEIVKKYGKNDGKGNFVIDKKSDNFEKALKELDEYNSIDVEVDVMQVDVETLTNSDLTSDVMFVLDSFMIKQEKD